LVSFRACASTLAFAAGRHPRIAIFMVNFYSGNLCKAKALCYGCKKVFRDVHVSGAKTNRAQLRRVIEGFTPAMC
jgi:hypothetical protein